MHRSTRLGAASTRIGVDATPAFRLRAGRELSPGLSIVFDFCNIGHILCAHSRWGAEPDHRSPQATALSSPPVFSDARTLGDPPLPGDHEGGHLLLGRVPLPVQC